MIKRIRSGFVGDGLAARTRRGSIIAIMQVVCANLIRLASNLVLTRLLFPEAFGLMALVQVVTSGLAMFSDIGLNASLIQNKRAEEPAFYNTAWTLQIIRGVIIAVITALIAPWVADFYDQPILAQMLPVVALTSIIAGFTPTKLFANSRDLQLGRLTVIEISNQVISLCIVVLLAWLMRSVWALVFGMVIGALLRNFQLRLFLHGPSNKLCWERAAVSELVHFGKYIFIGTLATFVISNADRAILGRFITTEALGLYMIALTFASIPMMLITTLTGRIMFPLYCKRKPDQSLSDRRKIFRARHAMTAGVMAVSVLLVAVGEPLIQFLYDPRYHAVAPLTVLVTLGFMPLLITTTYQPVLMAMGRSDLHALLTTVHALFKFGALYVLIREYGVVGAALAPVAATVLYYPAMVLITRRYRALDMVHDFVWSMFFSATAAVAYWYYGDRITQFSF